MKSTFRILFYVKKDKKRADGTLPIMCRITIDEEPSRFNTITNVNPTIWDAKAAIAIGRSNESVEVNALLNEIKTSIHNVYHELQTRENNVNAIKMLNTGKKYNSEWFVASEKPCPLLFILFIMAAKLTCPRSRSCIYITVFVTFITYSLGLI